MKDAARPLQRILGLGFGLAMVFGGTVGVGILRLPRTLAAALGDARWIVLFWVLGGVYALLGAVSVAELAAMLPEAGGFYVYARRAFGGNVGFAVGLSDWVNEVAALAYAAITAITFLGTFVPGVLSQPRASALLLLAAFTALHWTGLSLGSRLTRWISVAIGSMLMILVVACFASRPASVAGVPPAGSAATLPWLSMGMVAAVVSSLRAVLVTYDGWYSPIYLAEESTNPTRSLPRALIGGTLIVAALYILLNVALLRVLPLDVLAAADLPAAAAARVVLPRGGAELITLVSLLTVLSLMNAVLLLTPRIVFAIGRDGLLTGKATQVSAGGTPRVALSTTSVAAGLLILTGTFEQIVALAAVMFLVVYISAYASLLVLRRREPGLARPYRVFGFPYATLIVLAGCVVALLAAVADDPRSGLIAGGLLLVCVPAYLSLRRRG